MIRHELKRCLFVYPKKKNTPYLSMKNDLSFKLLKSRVLSHEKMAFLCPSQLTVKKKVLRSSHGKNHFPLDSYTTNGTPNNSTPSEYKSALKSPSSSTDSSNKGSQQRTVRIRETSLKHETLVERKIKAASPSKPANIRVKITQEFKSEDEEEINVRKGQYVIVLYQKHDWVYVRTSAGQEGYIPYIYCSTINVSTDSKSSTSGYEESFEESDEVEQPGVNRKSNSRSKTSEKHQYKSRARVQTTTSYFPKRPYGPQMTVLYNYKARYENDLRVVRGESVMLLNDQDPEWLWVATDDGEEGFVPRTFVISHTCEGCRRNILKEPENTSCTNNGTAESKVSDTTTASSSSIDKKSKESDSSSSKSTGKKYSIKGSKLIALFDFEGTAFDDLNVVAGEYVFANLKDQIVPHWIWAYSPYRKRSGFVPEEYLKEPVVTDI